MVISEKHNFIYIAVSKTGTTSVHNAFSNLDDETLFIERLNEKRTDRVNQSLYKHIKGPILKKEIKNYNKYFKFTFIRNPWDRLVSWFRSHDRRMNPGWLSRSNLEKIPEYFWDNQSEWIFEGDSCLVDFVGRYENFQEDFNVVCDKIGIPRKQLPHKNKSKHKHYTEYYNDETRQIVAENYAKDIEYFGYEFGK